MKEKAKVEEEKKDEEKEDPKGIPEFWLTVFKNVDLLSEMLQVGRERRAHEGAVVSSGVQKQVMHHGYLQSLENVLAAILWCKKAPCILVS